MTPASGLQTQAFSGARNLTGNPGVSEGIDATRSLLDFSPDSVEAGQLNGMDLSGYTDPWENEVVSRSLADIERARAGAISEGQGIATRAGAYGGSRHGVADSLTNDAALRTAGSTAATLRSAGHQNAQQAALFDITNRLNAATGNADRGLQGASFRLGAADQLHRQGTGADASSRANIGLQAGLGGIEREINASNDPAQARIRFYQQIAQLLGIDPSLFTGQTINQSGTQSGTSTQSGGFQFGFGPDGFSFGSG